jgi:hypothetical protein
MSFLAVWALAGLALVAVPLAIHFRRRRSGRRVAFPALRYLRQAGDATARSLRTRDLLLLAVRVALLTVLVAAAAGPLIGRGGVADHGPSDVAIVIDNSGSTGRIAGDVTVLDGLIERARATLTAGRIEDRFWIVPAVGPPLTTAAVVARAAAALERVERTDGAGDLRAAVERIAAALPSEPGRHREIQLLSDWQRTAFAPAGASDTSDGESARSSLVDFDLTVYRPDLSPSDNVAVRSLTLSQGAMAPAGIPQTVFFELSSSPERPASDPSNPSSDESEPPDLPVRLRVDGRTVGATRVSRSGRGAVRLPELPPGPHYGRLEIEPRGLRADDARFFALMTPLPRPVLHAGPADGFVRVALETLRGAGRIGRLDRVDSMGDPRALVLLEATRGVRAADLGSQVVLVPPADPVDLPAFNQFLRELQVEWRARPDTMRGDLWLAAGAGDVPGLAETRILRRYRLEGLTAADSVWLQTGDGEPWLVQTRRDNRTLVLLASPLVVSASTLPASPAMLPFVERILLRASEADGRQSLEVEAGQSLSVPSWVDSVGALGEAMRRLEGGAPLRLLRAGLYELRGEGRRVFVAVNVPPTESELATIGAEELEELFPGANVTIAGPGERAWERGIYRDRRGVDVVPWLILAAIVLAVTESGLATPRRASRGRQRSN